MRCLESWHLLSTTWSFHPAAIEYNLPKACHLPICPTPYTLRGRFQVMSRLNTNQRISKMDLMSADLSIVEAKPSKVCLIPQMCSSVNEVSFSASLQCISFRT